MQHRKNNHKRSCYSKKMELTDFPNEILHNIISNIALNSDLAKVTLVSHRFKALTEPLQYRNVHLDAEPHLDYRSGFLPTLKQTDQLIANLKARPKLGRYTTAFSLRVTHPLWYETYPQISIISRMPELRKLSFDPPAVHGGGTPNECKKMADLRLDFSHVTNHYDGDSTSWLNLGIPLEIIAKTLWHPSLRKVQAERVFFTGNFDNFERDRFLGPRRYGRSSVEDLRFLNCCPRIDGNVVTAFINAIQNLKCFALEIKSPWEPIKPPYDLAPEIDVRPALQAHHATIEELAISTSDDALEYHGFGQSPGSFVQWTALKRLAVPFFMLSRDLTHHGRLHEVLPPQLEELQLEKQLWTFSTNGLEITEEFQPIREDGLTLMKELAKNNEACVPRLKRLIWWLQYPSSRESSNPAYSIHPSIIEIEGLVSMFKNSSVQFEWIPTALFKDTPFGKRLYEW